MSFPAVQESNNSYGKPIPESYLNQKDLDLLYAQGFPKGLARSLVDNASKFPLRIWVLDNSGSMGRPDGHRFVEKKNSELVRVSCTRWEEMQETVLYHAELAGRLHAPTIFRLLNPSAGVNQLSIADKGDDMIYQDLQNIRVNIRRASPGGVTPLTRHIREIRDIIQAMSPSLRSEGKRVAIILATDGLPSSDKGLCGNIELNEFVQALNALEGLPIWIVIRLFTDEDEVFEFYDRLDTNVELSIEVLNDFGDEAEDVYKHNKFLNYTLALHRCREMGYNDPLLDLLDHRKLTRGELRDFLFLLFGEEVFDDVPDPDADWDGFFNRISDMVSKEKEQWNPIYKKPKSLIDMKQLNYDYNNSGSICSACSVS